MYTKYSYIKRIPKKIPKKRKYSKLIIFAASLAVIIFTYIIFYPKTKQAVNFSSIPTPSPTPTPKKIVNIPSGKLSEQQINNLLNSQISQLPGSYSILIKDLKKNKTYSVNPTDSIGSASIYKLALMYKTFDLINKNQLAYTDEVSTGATVQESLTQMITVSDNDSALALANLVGWQQTQDSLEAANITGFQLTQETPTVTASAVAALLEKIYYGKAISKMASEKMLDLLLAQQINNKIPKYFPTDIKIAHKTGELDSVSSDAGIIFGKKSDYIFVFLSDTPAPADATENIALLSKTMFDALER